MKEIKINGVYWLSQPILILIMAFSAVINLSAQKNYDVVIKNGLIYDGSLNTPYTADIAISGDKIAAIGNIEPGTAKVIDASGLIITPGFIDIHEHSDELVPLVAEEMGLTREQRDSLFQFQNYIYQGVTTAVSGNCGGGITNTDEWLGYVNENHFGINIAHLVPHGSIRKEVLGEEYQPAVLTADELNQMKSRVREEMEKGAFGLSTGLTYSPGRVATTNEIVELAKVVHEYDGYYASHMRDETASIRDDGKIALLESIKETIEIGRQANIPVQISHLKLQAPYNIDAIDVINEIEAARAEGYDVTCDSYPFNAGLSEIIILLPVKYKDAFGVKEEYKSGDGLADLRQYVVAVLEDVTPDEIILISYDAHPEYIGLTLREVAELKNVSAVDCFIEMAFEEHIPSARVHAMSLTAMEEFLTKPYVFTCSDAAGWLKSAPGMHPRYYSTFTKKLKKYVLDENKISLEFAIRAATQLPAQKLGLADRGGIAAGNFADIAVFDLNKLDYESTYENPNSLSKGVEHLFVNGVQTIKNGELTGLTGGKALRKTDYTTGVKNIKLQTELQLNQNYPNPFNPSTKISFSIPTIGRSGTSLHNTKLIVYDILGREVKTLFNKPMQPGIHEVRFNAGDLASGTYLYRIHCRNLIETKKMLLIK